MARAFALALGLLIAVTGTLSAGSVSYQYDGLGRLKTVTYADGSVVNFTLDPEGNRTTVTQTAPNPPSGTLQFTTATFAGGEASGQRIVTVSVSRLNGSFGSVGVSYSTSNGTATVAGGDYTATSGQLSWANADTANKTFNVTLLDDALVEGSEGLNLALSAPTGGGSLGTQITATLTIADDDNPPAGTLQFSAASFLVVENAGSVALTVTRTGGSFGSASVNLSTVAGGTGTAGVDYTAVTNQPLTWTNGDTTTKTFNLAILDDTVFDGSKTVNLALSGASGASLGGQSTSTVAISDNESALPSVPANLRTSPVGLSLGGTFTVLWDASTGATVNHYSLNELITVGTGQGTVTNYVIASPTLSKAFSKGGQQRDWQYKVRACMTGDETQCSNYSSTVTISVCPSGGCP